MPSCRRWKRRNRGHVISRRPSKLQKNTERALLMTQQFVTRHDSIAGPTIQYVVRTIQASIAQQSSYRVEHCGDRSGSSERSVVFRPRVVLGLLMLVDLVGGFLGYFGASYRIFTGLPLSTTSFSTEFSMFCSYWKLDPTRCRYLMEHSEFTPSIGVQG